MLCLHVRWHKSFDVFQQTLVQARTHGACSAIALIQHNAIFPQLFEGIMSKWKSINVPVSGVSARYDEHVTVPSPVISPSAIGYNRSTALNYRCNIIAADLAIIAADLASPQGL